MKLTQNRMQIVNGISIVMAQIQLRKKVESLIVFRRAVFLRVVAETFEMYVQNRWPIDDFELLQRFIFSTSLLIVLETVFEIKR